MTKGIIQRLKTQGFGICHEAATLIEQQAKEAETNVLNICQQQHTIAEQAKEIEELKMYSKLDADILEESKKETQTLHTQNERLAKEIEGLKTSEPYKTAIKLITDEREITHSLRTQNERLVKVMDWVLCGRLAPWVLREPEYEEAKALLAEINPSSTAPRHPSC